MNITSFEFVLFFVFIVLIRNCLRNFATVSWLLLAASIFFYLTWSIPCIVLILLTSVMDFSIGQRLSHVTEGPARRRLLGLSLVVNLGLLASFKYSNFVLENVWYVLGSAGLHFQQPHYNIILPPAISFYTFASIAYVIDVYYERIPVCHGLRDYTLFITFFPKLLSGPIVRAGDFLPQLKERIRASVEDVEIGVTYFLVGAVKKLVIADQIGGPVSLIFAAPGHYDGLSLVVGVLGYGAQIYCDFSGYTDMAIGCARILGFKFPQNFQMPYSSTSVTEFWRRWHMTLSTWFRDYLFLPLETATRANPYPTLRVSINLIITMLLIGLWHGPSWTFVVFGGIHGVALAVHRVWTKWNPLSFLKDAALFRIAWSVCARLLTLGVVVLGFVFFRSESLGQAGIYFNRIVHWSHGVRLISPFVLAALAVLLLVHLLVNKDRNLMEEIPQRSMPIRILSYACLILLLASLAAAEPSTFIYFQF